MKTSTAPTSTIHVEIGTDRSFSRERPQHSSVVDLLAAFREDGYRITLPEQKDLRLPAKVIDSVRHQLESDNLRKDGFRIYRPDDRLTNNQLDQLLDWHSLTCSNDTPLQSIEKTITKIDRNRNYLGTQGESGKVYRVQNALSHALMYQAGWIDQEDFSWLCAEKLGIHDDTDFAYFMGTDPRELKSYASSDGGFYEQGQEILKAIGCDTKNMALRRLAAHSLVLEIDLASYAHSLPELRRATPLFSLRNDPDGKQLEIIAPLPPPTCGVTVIAAVNKIQHN